MGFDLGAFGQGLGQGVDHGQQILMRAQQLKQFQAQLDEQKRDLMAKAAVFAGGMGAQPMPQPPAPPSAPASPGGPMPQGPGPAPAMPPSGPQGAPPMGAPASGPMAAPQPQGPAPAAPAGPMSQGGAQPGDFDPQHAVMEIAQRIKAANPNIDPLTLFSAVQQNIELMKGVQPTIRQQMQQQAQVWKETYQSAQLDQGERRLGQGDQRIQQGEQRIGEQSRHNVAMEGLAGQRIQDADRRLQMTQDAIDRRASDRRSDKVQTQAQRDRLNVLKARLAQAKTKVSNIMSGAGTGDITAAGAEVEKIQQQIVDFQQKVMSGVSPNPAERAPGDDRPAAAQKPASTRPTATDDKGNKVEWDGTAWVPVRG